MGASTRNVAAAGRDDQWAEAASTVARKESGEPARARRCTVADSEVCSAAGRPATKASRRSSSGTPPGREVARPRSWTAKAAGVWPGAMVEE